MKNDKKVLFVVTGLDVGGAELLVAETVISFRKVYKDVHLIYIKDCTELLKKERYESLNPIYMDLKSKGLVGSVNFLRRYIKNNRIDTVFSHLSMANIITKFCSIGLRKVEFYNTYHNMDPRLQKRSPNVLFYNFVDRFYINLCRNHYSIAISKAVKEYHCRVKHLKESKVHVIYNGIFKDGESIRSQRERGEIKKLVTVGRLEPVKNVTLQIELISELKNRGYKDISLDIVGDGTERERLEERVRELELESYVNFLGSRLDLENLLPNYDLFISSSRVEGFGLTILEAISYGLPVLTSKSPAVEEILDRGEYGILYENDNLMDFIERFETLLRGEVDLERLTDKAYQYFLKNFSFDAYITKLTDL